MGGLNPFKKPKVPKIEAPKPMPIPDDALAEAEQRKKLTQQLARQGRASTMRVADNTMQNKGIGA